MKDSASRAKFMHPISCYIKDQLDKNKQIVVSSPLVHLMNGP